MARVMQITVIWRVHGQCVCFEQIAESVKPRITEYIDFISICLNKLVSFRMTQ